MKTHAPATAPSASLTITLLLVVSVGHTASAQIPFSPWRARDIGAPTLGGSASRASGVFTVLAAGADIWGARDQFHFVYQKVAGDVEITARVRDVTTAHVWSKAGVMIRASLQPASAHGYALVSAGRGVHFQRRTAKGGASSSTMGSSGTAAWVRAVRLGTRVTTYWSANGTSWTLLGSDSIALGKSAYVGIAVTSHHRGARTTAKVSNVAVVRRGLPAGQQSTDIGAPRVAGSAAFSNGTYTITAGGADIWDRADELHFVYQPMTGNGQVTARVASLTNTDAWAKAGVMIRESLSATSRHAMVVTSGGKGYAFQRRQETGAYSVHTSGGSGRAPGWVRLVRTGSLFEAYRSSNGRTWTKIGSDTIAMGGTVYAGLAVTSHNPTAATTAAIDSFRLKEATGMDQPPAVSITSPATGTQYTAPATVMVSADAIDPEGRMASVDFYAESTLIARDTTSPYRASWTAPAAGTYALAAVAHDAAGNSSTSAPVTVTVGAIATGLPKYVVFTASADHGTSVTSYLFEVFASGANPSTAKPVASSDLGKPKPASNGDITAERSALFNGLAAGTYVATVTAIGPGGRTRSAGIAFSR